MSQTRTEHLFELICFFLNSSLLSSFGTSLFSEICFISSSLSSIFPLFYISYKFIIFIYYFLPLEPIEHLSYPLMCFLHILDFSHPADFGFLQVFGSAHSFHLFPPVRDHFYSLFSDAGLYSFQPSTSFLHSASESRYILFSSFLSLVA